MTWGHVVLASLDVAMEKSQYGEAPLLSNLRAELRNEALSRIEGDTRGLGENDLVHGVRQLRIYEQGRSMNGGLQDRFLQFLSDRPTGLDDWTLRIWLKILEGSGVTPEHFGGNVEWASLKTPVGVTDEKVAREQLDELIGLDNVKAQIRRLEGFLMAEHQRGLRGLPRNGRSLHTLFLGNPGTGKTTVARILGKSYREIGILSTGHFVEVDRSHIVGTHIGETEANMTAIVKQALGGVLFIDEAYSLATGGENDFGKRAIDQLVRDMSEHRDDLVVIAAGYTDRMTDFVQTNPGLPGRFAKRVFFEDYSDAQLLQIFTRRATSRKFTVSNTILDAVARRLQDVRAERGEQFGNAREVDTIWEDALEHHGMRIQAMLEREEDIDAHLTELVPDDIRSAD